jgi:hypothetical protein
LFDSVAVKGCGLPGAFCCANAITGQAVTAAANAKNLRRRMFTPQVSQRHFTIKGTERDQAQEKM